MTGTWMNTHHIADNHSIKSVENVPSIFALIKENCPEKIVYSATAWKELHTRLIKDDL